MVDERDVQKAAGFEWDRGNRKKCQEHGVSIAEIKDLFTRRVMILLDPAHSQSETRLRAIGKTTEGRSVFLVFTIRKKGRKRLIRPISARYMHAKESKSYEEENPDL
jgi:uncharacterized DUF497 family protein